MITLSLYDPKSIADYEAVVAIHNQTWPDDLHTAEEWRHRDQDRSMERYFQRFVAHKGDALIAEGVVMEPPWMYVPGKYVFFYSLLPAYEELEMGGASIHGEFYSFVVDHLAAREPEALLAYAREDKLAQVRWLLDNGFQQQMRYPDSQLDVQAFDPAPFADVCARVAASGIEFVTAAELQSRDPDWQRKAHELCSEIEMDIPSPDPPTPEPFEEFVKIFSNPAYLPEGWLIAVDGAQAGEGDVGPYVGITMLARRLATPEKLSTWITGVTRPYRRRGIALALKVQSIEFARRYGAKFIGTDNEENNPMFQINLKLGFEPLPAWSDFEKLLG